MFKLIIFDLDGVLVDAKDIHFETLNQAIAKVSGDRFAISRKEHLSTFDGLKTSQKLEMLSKERGLPLEHHADIWKLKQMLTQERLEDIKPDNQIRETMQWLKSEGYSIACCSNSIRRTIYVALTKIGAIEFMDLILSNEDVSAGKPYPSIYWKAMTKSGALPEETLIIEDSPPGLLAAHRSGAMVARVDSPKQVSRQNIKKIIERNMNSINSTTPRWKSETLNVLIPMAGAGTRFEKAGYTFPKPLIEVNGKPMIQLVVENLNIDANFIYVVQRSHREKYNLDTMLNLITPGCKIVEVDGLTEGAACTALAAKYLIDNDSQLFFANSDQFVDWNSNEFMYKMTETGCDGGIVIFKAAHPKWSFAKVGDDGLVTQVAEKKPISDNATVGFYYWSKGSDFVKYAERMIESDDRVNNEFYVCPVFNHAIEDGKQIRAFDAEAMWGLGTPEDLNHYLNNHKR